RWNLRVLTECRTEEAKSKAAMRATVHAVHAQVAFRLVPWDTAGGIISALAVEQAAVALVAGGLIFVQPQHRPPRDRAQQRAKRADGAAPQPRDAQAGEKNCNEQDSEEQTLRKMRLAEIQHDELQNRMDHFTAGSYSCNMAVLK